MPPVTKIDDMLSEYKRFRKLWVQQGDMMNPEDYAAAQVRLVELSDQLADMESDFPRSEP